MRRQHLPNEIRRDPGKARPSLPSLTCPGHRVRLAIALGLVAASGALVSGLFLTGQHTSAVKRGQDATAVKKSSSGVFHEPPVGAADDGVSAREGFWSAVSVAAGANDGVPALTTEGQLPDGSPWSFVQFVAGGSTIVVMGHPDQATLQAAAQSILDRSS